MDNTPDFHPESLDSLEDCSHQSTQLSQNVLPELSPATRELNKVKAQLAQEVQKREYAETKLRHYQERLDKLSSNISGMLFQCVRQPNGAEFLTYVSPQCRDILDIEPTTLWAFSQVLEQLPQTAAAHIRSLMDRSASDLSHLFWEGTFETRTDKSALGLSHPLKWLQLTAQPSRTPDGNIVWDGLLCDITNRKKAELAQERQAQQFKNLVANVPGIIYRCIAKPGCPIEFISGAVTAITGYPIENFTNSDLRSLDEITYPDDQLMVQAAIDQALENGEFYQIEYRLMTANGEPRWVLERGRSTWDPKAKLQYLDGVIIDINDLKLAEAQVQASLTEKDVLLREVHHRVKNNLNVVHSLLEMQSRQAQNIELQSLLTESQQRLQVMALIHEQLYRSDQLARINFADYIKGLVKNFSAMVKPANGQVQLQLNIEPVWFALETAIPIGLILNELLTNALKYAFPDHQNGVVEIILERQEHRLHLAVCDNGVGMPDTDQINHQSSLGLRLVSILADQIDAELRIASVQGAEFHLTFDA